MHATLAKASGKFVPHVPLMVKVLNEKGKKEGAVTPLQKAPTPVQVMVKVLNEKGKKVDAVTPLQKAPTPVQVKCACHWYRRIIGHDRYDAIVGGSSSSEI